ncbi:hypothetical protein SESBI_37532 [Sesbania bispinosa]|nr:hypothetical protein SESBI_37532 [Sesbania bispinosa]
MLGKRTHTRAFEHEGDGIAAIIGLDGDDVVVAGAFQHLGHVIEVHAHGDVAVAAVVLKPFRPKQQRHQSHVTGVHGLKGEPGGRAIEVRIVNQVLDRLEHLLQQGTLD